MRPANSRYYGPARSVYIEKDGSPVETKDVVYLDLKNWSTPPTGKVAAVDVELGRMTFASGEEPSTGVNAGTTTASARTSAGDHTNDASV